MDDPNITMDEYIRLEEEKARRRGKVFNWETATYAIVFNETLTSEAALSCEPTVNPLNVVIDFRILFDESDNEDCTVIFDKNSGFYKIISVSNLKTDSENDNDKVNMPFLPSPESTVSYINDLDYFNNFEKEFPAIIYNDAQMSKLDFFTEPTLSPQHIDEFDLKDETSLSECDEVEQNVLYFNDLFYFNVIYPDDLKSDEDNDDDKIDIEHSSGDLPVIPLPNVINNNDRTRMSIPAFRITILQTNTPYPSRRYGVSVPALTKNHKRKEDQYAVKMDDPNITMDEYIRLEEEKARRLGKSIVFNETLTSKAALSCEPTVSPLNDEIDFRISFDESDDEDCTITVLKTNTPYPSRRYGVSVPALTKDHKRNEVQYAVSRRLNTPYSRYGYNIIFWKISNVVPTSRNPQYAVLQLSRRGSLCSMPSKVKENWMLLSSEKLQDCSRGRKQGIINTQEEFAFITNGILIMKKTRQSKSEAFRGLHCSSITSGTQSGMTPVYAQMVN
ncbi:hypothetical protein Tco_0878337 [Tanacetum coccineum]|uniref:Uncharacterized protein n=1 Tax=Tanacetum coccineum TaxID=301880 RepID=A0ABQ5BY20_9ASTR